MKVTYPVESTTSGITLFIHLTYANSALLKHNKKVHE